MKKTSTPAAKVYISATLAELNRTVHEPARLAILTVLSACESADFVFLRASTGLTAGNLSVQITRLLEAGLVTVEKVPERARSITLVSLTEVGHCELEVYWRAMEQLQRAVRQPKTEPRSAGASRPGPPEPAPA